MPLLLSRLFCLNVLFMLALSGLALAQDPIPLGSVLSPRGGDVSAAASSAAAAAAPDAPASLLDVQERLISLENTLQAQTQQIEEMQKTIRTLEQKLAQPPEATAQTETKTQDSGQNDAPESPAQGDPSPSEDNPTLEEVTPSEPLQDPSALPSSEAGAYQTGIDTLKQGQYAEARNHFEAFIKNNPNDTRLPNAYYWIGETYYAQQNYRKSGEMFLKSFQDYPDSPKAPDSLLKLGLSLQSAKQTKQACQSFDELLRRYPKASPTIIQRAKRAKASCV
jgi:tol-pal system protein YbgF